MRVAQAQDWTVEDVADSYAHWWRAAGLHSATSREAHGWLDMAEPQPAMPPAPHVAELATRATVTPIRPSANPQAAPGGLAAFREWLATDQGQPEAGWMGPLFLPSATADAPLLVICDMPDDAAAAPDALPFSPAAGRFVTAMLAAIGMSTEAAGFATLATRRPPGGLLDDAVIAALAVRMRHYLALARPRAALILGDRTSRALLAAQGAAAGGLLPELRHDGGTLPVAALAAPELLMRRPLAKAASWQTLRLLRGAMNR